MQNQTIPNGSKVDTEYGVFEVLDYNVNIERYFCYKHNFDGHSGISYFGGNYINTKYEGQCWWFSEDQISLVKETKDYRRMKPNDLIDIVLDGNEFKVPLGDLVHAEGLLGGSTGRYGAILYEALSDVFDECGEISEIYDLDDVASFQTKAFKKYFIDTEQERQTKDLEAQIVAKSNELLELQTKLKELS